jgi:hypothetical protein
MGAGTATTITQAIAGLGDGRILARAPGENGLNSEKDNPQEPPSG